MPRRSDPRPRHLSPAATHAYTALVTSRAQFHARRCLPTRQVVVCPLGTLLLWFPLVPADRAARGGAAAPLAALRGSGRARCAASAGPRTQQCSTRRGVGNGTRGKAPPCWCPAGCPGRLGRALPSPNGAMHSGSTLAPRTPAPRTTRTPLLRRSGPMSASFAPGAPALHLSASVSQRTLRWDWRCASGTRSCATSARRFRRGAQSRSPSSPSSWRRSSARTHVENNAGSAAPSGCLAEADRSSGQPEA